MSEGMERIRWAPAATHSEQQQKFISDVRCGMKCFRHHGRAPGDRASYILANRNSNIGEETYRNHSVGT